MKQQISGNTFYVNINGVETATDVVSEYSYEPGIVDIWACNMGKDYYRVYPEPMRTYYFIIRDNEIMVRHFVPVPAGLQIGDFTVPENGMWDIVEQKFYGLFGDAFYLFLCVRIIKRWREQGKPCLIPVISFGIHVP